MGKSENNISQQPEGKPRPSLFSPGSIATDHNILDAMANRGSPALASKPRRLAWLLVPLLAATGWGIATQLLQAPANVAPVTTAPQPAATATPTLSVSAAATPANPFNTLETAAEVGIQSGTATTAQAPAAFDMQAALNTPAPQAEVVPKTQAKVVAEKKKSAASSQASNKTAAAKSATPKPKVATAKTPAEIKTASKTGMPASKKISGRDPDVELLSAIMKHLGDENSSTPTPPRSAQTIADLVKSCKGKDAIEALLCQRRICEGSWGKAQACPQNLAPKQTAKAGATLANN